MTPDSEGLHPIANADSSEVASCPGGGAVAIRGFLAQTAVALLEIATAKPPFVEITLEPRIGNDQFDYIWSDGTHRFARQVKSTQNSFTQPQVENWAAKMEDERTTEECSLVLVGLFPPAMNHLTEVGRVKIERHNLNLRDLIERAAHRLDLFMHAEAMQPVDPTTREVLVRSMINHLEELSTQSKTYTRSAFSAQLREWLRVPDLSEGNAYPRVVEGVNRELQRLPALAQFLQACDPDCFTSPRSEVKLCDAAGCTRLDIKPLLDAVLDRLNDSSRDKAFIEALSRVMGGILVLAVDPKWIRQQREALRRHDLAYPGENFDKADGSQSVNYLNLVLCAVTDRLCSFEYLLTPSSEVDDKLLPAPALLLKGITANDKRTELKLGIIKHVQKRSPSSEVEIEKIFDEVREQIADAFQNSRPYHATDPSFEEHLGLLKGDLNLSALLLVFPRGGSESDIITKAHLLVTRLHRLGAELKRLV